MKHAAFLCAMNVGGRRVTNDQLRLHFQAMGFAEVDVFRASGNVVFTAPESAAELTERIQGELAGLLGYQIIAFLRSAKEVRAIAKHEPFGPAPAGGKLQVALLAKRLMPSARRDALA
ncbi:MAG: DUF1697 domain-containing protein, partial [Actinomycetota bacterium]|nr:DUF1697 domain-containing protein [Actinomycetota bacterium]